MSSEGREWGICTFSFIVLPFPLKRPISSERPSQVDLDALCRTQAPAVPAEFISGHDYQWQRLGEEVVSLTDRQQNPGDRMAEGWSCFKRGGEKKWNKTSHWNHPEGLVWCHYCGWGKGWTFSSLIRSERPSLVGLIPDSKTSELLLSVAVNHVIRQRWFKRQHTFPNIDASMCDWESLR